MGYWVVGGGAGLSPMGLWRQWVAGKVAEQVGNGDWSCSTGQKNKGGGGMHCREEMSE